MIDAWLTQKKVTEKKIRYNPYEVYSNCITEIPRNIKLEFSGNTLILKAGSILTRTGSTYATETTVNDLTYTIQSSLGDGHFVIFGNANGLGTPRKIDNVYSGNSSQYPTTGLTSTTVYFNTNDKLIYRPNSDFSAWNTWSVDYPLCVIKIESGVASFAKDSNGNDMIFNGAGFIGHHAFTYPNVKTLLPDELNEDGSLKSVEDITNKLSIIELSLYSAPSGYVRSVMLRNGEGWHPNAYREVDTYNEMISETVNFRVTYCKELNACFWKQNDEWVELSPRTSFITYSGDGANITQFDIRQPYEGAAVQTLYEPEEYEVEYDRTFFNLEDTVVFKAKNILETQEQSLAYEPDLGIDLKRFLDPDVKIQNRTFEAYSIQKLSEQGINTIELVSDKETFRQLFDYKVAETDNEGMIAQ